MDSAGGIVLNALAAGMFGAAVILLATAAHRLIRQHERPTQKALTSMRRAEMRQRALDRSGVFRLAIPFISSFSSTIEKLGLDPLREYVHEPYVRAGYPGGLNDDELLAVCVMLSGVFTFVAAFVTIALFGVYVSWLALLGIPLGFMAVVAHLKSRAKEREVLIVRAMPYVMDLLVLMLRSGTSLRLALSRVIEDDLNHPFSIEIGQVIAEIDVGSPRTDAFKKMAVRLKIPDITAFVDTLTQSEELGWPLADTLERLADRMNAERILNAQATAGAAGVYVMLPSTLVLASAVLLMFAPFIVKYLVTGTLLD